MDYERIFDARFLKKLVGGYEKYTFSFKIMWDILMNSV